MTREMRNIKRDDLEEAMTGGYKYMGKKTRGIYLATEAFAAEIGMGKEYMDDPDAFKAWVAYLHEKGTITCDLLDGKRLIVREDPSRIAALSTAAGHGNYVNFRETVYMDDLVDDDPDPLDVTQMPEPAPEEPAEAAGQGEAGETDPSKTGTFRASGLSRERGSDSEETETARKDDEVDGDVANRARRDTDSYLSQPEAEPVPEGRPEAEGGPPYQDSGDRTPQEMSLGEMAGREGAAEGAEAAPEPEAGESADPSGDSSELILRELWNRTDIEGASEEAEAAPEGEGLTGYREGLERGGDAGAPAEAPAAPEGREAPGANPMDFIKGYNRDEAKEKLGMSDAELDSLFEEQGNLGRFVLKRNGDSSYNRECVDALASVYNAFADAGISHQNILPVDYGEDGVSFNYMGEGPDGIVEMPFDNIGTAPLELLAAVSSVIGTDVPSEGSKGRDRMDDTMVIGLNMRPKPSPQREIKANYQLIMEYTRSGRVTDDEVEFIRGLREEGNFSDTGSLSNAGAQVLLAYGNLERICRENNISDEERGRLKQDVIDRIVSRRPGESAPETPPTEVPAVPAPVAGEGIPAARDEAEMAQDYVDLASQESGTGSGEELEGQEDGDLTEVDAEEAEQLAREVEERHRRNQLRSAKGAATREMQHLVERKYRMDPRSVEGRAKVEELKALYKATDIEEDGRTIRLEYGDGKVFTYDIGDPTNVYDLIRIDFFGESDESIVLEEVSGSSGSVTKIRRRSAGAEHAPEPEAPAAPAPEAEPEVPAERPEPEQPEPPAEGEAEDEMIEGEIEDFAYLPLEDARNLCENNGIDPSIIDHYISEGMIEFDERGVDHDRLYELLELEPESAESGTEVRELEPRPEPAPAPEPEAAPEPAPEPTEAHEPAPEPEPEPEPPAEEPAPEPTEAHELAPEAPAEEPAEPAEEPAPEPEEDYEAEPAPEDIWSRSDIYLSDIADQFGCSADNVEASLSGAGISSVYSVGNRKYIKGSDVDEDKREALYSILRGEGTPAAEPAEEPTVPAPEAAPEPEAPAPAPEPPAEEPAPPTPARLGGSASLGSSVLSGGEPAAPEEEGEPYATDFDANMEYNTGETEEPAPPTPPVPAPEAAPAPEQGPGTGKTVKERMRDFFEKYMSERGLL